MVCGICPGCWGGVVSGREAAYDNLASVEAELLTCQRRNYEVTRLACFTNIGNRIVSCLKCEKGRQAFEVVDRLKAQFNLLYDSVSLKRAEFLDLPEYRRNPKEYRRIYGLCWRDDHKGYHQEYNRMYYAKNRKTMLARANARYKQKRSAQNADARRI
jgi:hypothetical protein